MERSPSVVPFDEELISDENNRVTYENFSEEVDYQSQIANIKSVFRNLYFSKEYIKSQKFGKNNKSKRK